MYSRKLRRRVYRSPGRFRVFAIYGPGTTALGKQESDSACRSKEDQLNNEPFRVAME
jgi:hypothetical protein